MNLNKLICPSVLLVCLLFSSACSSVDINSAAPISIPAGLNTQEVKLAILSAIYPEKAPQKLTVGERITDTVLHTIFAPSHDGEWFIEELKQNSVVVGFNDGTHYFRTEFIVGPTAITQRIDGSRNLDQTKKTIHEDAIEWLGEFESKIRQSMGRVSAMKSLAEAKP